MKKNTLRQMPLSLYLFPMIFFLSILTMVIVYIVYFIISKEAFSGSLDACDLHDVATVTDASLSVVSTPAPFVLRKKPEIKYKEMYNSVLLANNYITVPSTSDSESHSKSQSVPVGTKENNYRNVYANTVSENTFMTSSGMNTGMTEMPKLKEIGMASKKYDELYNSTISDNKYNTTFDKGK